MMELPNHPNTIFVFGSNLSGVHGAGAARTAHVFWGAEWGVGEGLTGKSYALPTKEKDVKTTRTDEAILGSLRTFVLFARGRPDLIFLVTPVGCGLAGLKEDNVRGMLIEAGGPTKNMLLTASWFDPKVF